jgi:hypothetical protein
MSNMMPQGDALRNAIKWIAEKRNENPGINLSRLVDETSLKYDLSPKDSEFLLRFVKENQSD